MKELGHIWYVDYVFFPAGMTFAQAVSRFNSNISYNGLLHAVTADVSYSVILTLCFIKQLWGNEGVKHLQLFSFIRNKTHNM